MLFDRLLGLSSAVFTPWLWLVLTSLWLCLSGPILACLILKIALAGFFERFIAVSKILVEGWSIVLVLGIFWALARESFGEWLTELVQGILLRLGRLSWLLLRLGLELWDLLWHELGCVEAWWCLALLGLLRLWSLSYLLLHWLRDIGTVLHVKVII